jgi:hypothetical protein
MGPLDRLTNLSEFLLLLKWRTLYPHLHALLVFLELLLDLLTVNMKVGIGCAELWPWQDTLNFGRFRRLCWFEWLAWLWELLLHNCTCWKLSILKLWQIHCILVGGYTFEYGYRQGPSK